MFISKSNEVLVQDDYNYEKNINSKVFSIDEIKEGIQALVSRHNDFLFKRVYLFGSYARGEADGDSDLDLCVMLGTRFDLEKRYVIKKEIFTIFGKSCSVINIFSKFDSVAFAKNVAREAVLVYEDYDEYIRTGTTSKS